jgi:hypothetical protein
MESFKSFDPWADRFRSEGSFVYGPVGRRDYPETDDAIDIRVGGWRGTQRAN